MNALHKLIALLLLAMISTTAFAVTDNEVFAYAEANYSSLFSGTPAAGQTTYQGNSYDYRYYPGSQNYLAVDTSGVIWMLGAYTNNVVTSVGPVTAFAGFITAWEATQTVPSGINATAGNRQVTIRWNAVPGTASYNLYMASVSGVTKNNYSSLTDGMQHTGISSPYIHTGLSNGKTYYFVVTAVKANVEGGESTQVSAISSGLNDTGITASQCYQAGSDTLVSCSSAAALNNAQDGMSGLDTNTATNSNTDGRLGFSFANVAGGCVQDNVTGLMWEVKTTDGGLRDWKKTYSNYSATYNPSNLYGTPTDASGFVIAVNATNLCGFSDWRFPTADELQSIVDYGVYVGGNHPTVDETWFPNTAIWEYLSASPVVKDGYSNWAFSVSFHNGEVSHQARNVTNSVRLVRAGQTQTLSRYTVSTDGQEVTDNQTKLIWRRCAEGMVFSGASCTGSASTFNHEAALQRAATQATSTGIAWRLPNDKELSSIVDKSRVSPAIDLAAFPATPSGWFWSASPFVNFDNNNNSNGSSAWYVDFDNGWVLSYSRTDSDYVRLVRDVQ